MSVDAPYVLIASMDIEPAKEALFNEVNETEHIPTLRAVPGVISVARFTTEELTIVIGGRRQTIAAGDEPTYTLLWGLESPDVLTSEAWTRAVDQGRWPTQVRPYTRNRRHFLKRRIM